MKSNIKNKISDTLNRNHPSGKCKAFQCTFLIYLTLIFITPIAESKNKYAFLIYLLTPMQIIYNLLIIIIRKGRGVSWLVFFLKLLS